jgi:hypothetical protein
MNYINFKKISQGLNQSGRFLPYWFRDTEPKIYQTTHNNLNKYKDKLGFD